MYAGEDEDGDQMIGIRGRRWGAFGGSATPTPVTVSGVAVYTASFTTGFPAERISLVLKRLSDGETGGAPGGKPGRQCRDD